MEHLDDGRDEANDVEDDEERSSGSVCTLSPLLDGLLSECVYGGEGSIFMGYTPS